MVMGVVIGGMAMGVKNGTHSNLLLSSAD